MSAASVHMTINGERVSGESTVDVINPATGETFAQVPECSDAQLDAAFEAAAAAQPEWAKDEQVRIKALHAAAEAIRSNVEELSELLTLEQGKSRADARLELEYAAIWLEGFASIDIPDDATTYDFPGFEVSSIRRPLGVIAAITPWNFPVTLACWKIGPALRTGNTLVLKPSPYTPVSTLRVGELLNEVLPAGVLNIVSGGDSLGAKMTSHPIPAKVTLTGSVATGKAVARSAADDLKRVTLELGGNDPAILLEDVDIATVAPQLFWFAFMNNGQVCGCVKRIYVPESRHDELAEALAEIARGVVVGPGLEEGSVLGPINNKPQYERVLELLDDALNGGAQAIAGGDAIDRPGYFISPTVLTGAGRDSRIVKEEQFGPVLPLIAYSDLDEVLAEVNDSKFGLGSSVWSADAARAREVASRLESGTTYVNTHAITGPGVPFGGTKWSGLGVENGLDGLREYTQLQVTYEAAGA
jgi:acyl-CoA reductase-like NAD-dependent aldehyde dehydrogenase